MSGWTNDAVQSITIPSDAGPADPRIVITGQPNLDNGSPMAAAIFFYWNETDFFYLGINSLSSTFGILTIGTHTLAEGVTNMMEMNGNSTSNNRPITFFGGTAGANSTLDIRDDVTVSGQGTIRLSGDDYQFRQGISNVSVPRGTIDIADTSSTAGIGATETVVSTLTDTVGNLEFGRRYRVDFIGRVASTVANDRVGLRIRQTSASGTIEADCGEILLPVANVSVPVSVWCLYSGRSVGGETVVLTARRTAGTGTITYSPVEGMANDQAPSSLV